MKITLDDYELKMAMYLAELRDKTSSGNHKMGHQVEHANFMGIAGEIAYCKMHNLYFTPMASGRPYDVIHGVYRFDIKTSDNPHRTTFINEGCVREGVDGFISMHTDDGREYECLGKISRKRLLKDYVVKDCRYSPAYVIAEDDLIQ
jgi:hypothetical protein